MTYRVSDADIAGFYRDGYIVFRQVLPGSLIADLRRECEKAAQVARRVNGPQAQRLQPVQKYEGELNMRPFREYAELPAIKNALAQVLSPRHAHGRIDVMGVLLEPADTPWCTAWHRDMTLKTSRLDPQSFQDLMLDWSSANQVNCPLYDDECTWFVPGSHLRARDLPDELAHVNPPIPIDHGQSSRIADPVEKERVCRDYTAGMPGAVQLRLNAGDFCMYRPIGWHTGNYLPYKKRATLHDGVFTPEYEAWWREWIKGGSPRWTRQVQSALVGERVG